MKELNKEPVKIKVRFLEDRTVQDAEGKVTQEFKKDEIHELPEDSANHWITRRAAVRYEDPGDKTKQPTTKVGMAKSTDVPPAKGAKETQLPPPGSTAPSPMTHEDIKKT